MGRGKVETMRRGALTIALAICLAGCAESGRRFASIGTAGTGGVYYPLGGALARMLGEQLPEVTFTAEVTGGSVENFNRVVAGEMDLGMAMGSALAKAVDDSDADDIRIVAPLYDNLTHVLVGARSGIADIAGLRGKRVSFGPPGSGTEQLSRDLLEAAGIGADGVTAHYLSFTESAAALADGAIDAAIISVGFPAAAVLEATTTGAARLIGLPPVLVENILASHSYYEQASLPAGSYPGVEQELQTVAVRNWLFAREALDATIVQAVLDVLQQRRAELEQVNDIAARIDMSAMRRAPLPLHPAATAWLQDQR